jgi:DNA polymerase I-like protein with 3'-5' exonuclease and polymerase domains
VCADYSAIELRIAAELAGETALIEVFEQGGDPHVLTAAVLTGTTEESDF